MYYRNQIIYILIAKNKYVIININTDRETKANTVFLKFSSQFSIKINFLRKK